MKNFTLRNALFVAFVFCLHVAKSQTVITLGAGQTIKTAYNTTIPATISGAYIIELSSTYTPASETYPITLAAKTGASLSNTITIRPASGVSSIITKDSSSTNPAFLLDGANYVILDGRAAGAGSTNVWTIENVIASSGAGAIELEDGANYNVLQYLNLAGGSQPTTGIVTLLCNSSGPGNTNDLIQYCNIGAYSSIGIPLNCILAYGNGVYANSFITVQNNSIHDFWSTYFAGSYTGCGISVTGTGTSGDYGDNWTINHNSFYRTELQNNGYYREAAIYFAPSPTPATATSTGNTISNNLIGGNVSALAHNDSIQGMYSTWEATSNPGLTFVGIEAHAKSVNITSNTISSILLFQYNSSDGFAGIYVPDGTTGGVINIQSNTVGSSYGSGKLYFTTSSTSVATGIGSKTFTVAAGLPYATGDPVFMFDASGSGLTCGCYAYMAGTVTSYSGTSLVVNATLSFYPHTSTQWYIGISRGIWNVNNGPTVGIYTGSSSMNATCNITRDTIGNLTSPVGYYNEVAGILTKSGINSIKDNAIFNITTDMTNVSSVSSGNVLGINGAIAGIAQQSTADGKDTISNNSIYSLYSILASGANIISGMELDGSPNGYVNIENANLVRDLSCVNANTVTQLHAIHLYSGTHTLTNNIIRLGVRSDTTSIKSSAAIEGITDGTPGTSGVDLQSVYHNTIYIAGTNVSGGAVNTYSFRRNNSSSAGGDQIDVRNNIFVNNRSNASGTARHFGIGLDNATGAQSDYNDVYTIGTGFGFGQVGGTAYSSKSTWNSATGLDANSISADPGFVAPLAVIPDFNAAVDGPCDHVAGAPVLITYDYYGNLRSHYTPVDLGAIVITSLVTSTAAIPDNDFHFIVTPNPAVDEITLKGNWKNELGHCYISIFNALGEKIYDEELETQDLQREPAINVSSLSRGIYLLQLKTKERAETIKFIKQ